MNISKYRSKKYRDASDNTTGRPYLMQMFSPMDKTVDLQLHYAPTQPRFAPPQLDQFTPYTNPGEHLTATANGFSCIPANLADYEEEISEEMILWESEMQTDTKTPQYSWASSNQWLP